MDAEHAIQEELAMYLHSLITPNAYCIYHEAIYTKTIRTKVRCAMFICPTCQSSLDHIGDHGIDGNYGFEILTACFECNFCGKSWNVKCSPVEFTEVIYEADGKEQLLYLSS